LISTVRNMKRTYVHELNREIRSISGRYVLEKEERISHRGRDMYMRWGRAPWRHHGAASGVQVCAGPWGVSKWKCQTDDRGLPLSEVEPISDPVIREELRRIILEKEDVSQVNFLK
jgi:hypothetical protein